MSEGEKLLSIFIFMTPLFSAMWTLRYFFSVCLAASMAFSGRFPGSTLISKEGLISSGSEILCGYKKVTFL